MVMEGCGITPVYDVNDDNNRNNNGFGDGGWIWVVFLFFLMAWGGGFGSFGGFGNNGAQGALTRGELCQDMNFQSLENATRGIQQGLCDGFYAQNTTMLQGFNGLQNSLCQSFAGVSSDLCNGFNAVNSNINQARFDAQNCCCETNRNIDSVKTEIGNVRYENAKNTCDIINASNANTQRIIDTMTQNTIQDLRDKATTYELQLSQQAQTANLVNQLRPCPVPAYLSCSPYTSYDPFITGRQGCGCGNGCGNTCC